MKHELWNVLTYDRLLSQELDLVCLFLLNLLEMLRLREFKTAILLQYEHMTWRKIWIVSKDLPETHKIKIQE